MRHLSNFFKNRRIERKLSYAQLARRVGYTNISKGANRIQKFEDGGKVHPDLLSKLAEVLEITSDEIQQRLNEDYQEWLTWANEPIRPHLVVRLLACVYQRVQLPEDVLTEEAMEAFAAEVAREKRMKTWLVLSRRTSLYFDVMGTKHGPIEATPEMPCEPFAVMGGKRVQFDFGGGTGLRAVDGPGG